MNHRISKKILSAVCTLAAMLSLIPAFGTTADAAVNISKTVYLIQNKGGKFLTADGTENSSNVSARARTNRWTGETVTQYFSVIEDVDGSYRLMSVSSGRLVDVSGRSSASGANIHLWDRVVENGKTISNQRWQFEDAGSGYYYIRSTVNNKTEGAGRYLDLCGCGGEQSGEGWNVWSYSGNKTNAQKWKLIPVTNEGATSLTHTQGYRIMTRGGMFLTIDLGVDVKDWKNIYNIYDEKYKEERAILTKTAVENGRNLRIETYKDRDYCQQFIFNANKQNQYDANNKNLTWTIMTNDGFRSIPGGMAYTQMVLDVNGVSKNDGANIYQWERHGGANQSWKLEHVGGGWYKIKSVNSGKYIDVAGVQVFTNGTNIHQWGGTTYDRNAAQEFMFLTY